MLSGEKVLITGPAGRIAHGIAKTLAADNEVWGVARFTDSAAREEVEGLGVTTRSFDLADPSARTMSEACASTPKAPDCCCRTVAMSRRRW
jgi:nucleoside-diphosphate-sugar epimerase